jgi:hypothetical protein
MVLVYLVIIATYFAEAAPRMVIEIAKHGAKHPSHRLAWENKMKSDDELSEVGMKSQALLGAEIRYRYSDLISLEYPSDIG